jgi:drug/metabolite transporter superfamily protein YnfA
LAVVARRLGLGLAGALVLFLYGIVPTYQPAHFSRTCAAYGGIFVVLSLPWGWRVDSVLPDRADLVGYVLCLTGAAVNRFRVAGAGTVRRDVRRSIAADETARS